jgi:hypothetical protein
MMSPEQLSEKVSEEIAAELFGAKILSNLTRPIFVERMLRHLLVGDWKHVGGDWAGWDLERGDGARIEVKQSSALQTWHDETSSPTPGKFDVRQRDGYFVGSVWVPTPCRPADVYVFAWHGVADRAVADHRNASQWKFYVVPERLLPTQKSLSLSRVISAFNAAEDDYLTVGDRVHLVLTEIETFKAQAEPKSLVSESA